MRAHRPSSCVSLCMDSLPGPALSPVTIPPAAWLSSLAPATAALFAATTGRYCRRHSGPALCQSRSRPASLGRRLLCCSLSLASATDARPSPAPCWTCWSTPRARYSGSALCPTSLNGSRLPLSRPLNLTHPSRTTRCHGGMVVSQVKDQDRGMMLRI